MRRTVTIALLLTLGACGGMDGNPSGWDGPPMEVDPSCTGARLTQYWSTAWG